MLSAIKKKSSEKLQDTAFLLNNRITFITLIIFLNVSIKQINSIREHIKM